MRKRKTLTRKSIVSTTVLGLLLLISLFAVGCGSSSKGQAPASQVNLTVTGTSGSITQSSVVAININ
jgi:predicted component of type VI protein secretion system